MGDQHACLHESDIAGLCKDIVDVKESVKRIEKCILGNGREGLMTRVAVIEENARNMPSARILMMMASIGGGITVALIYFGIKVLA